MHPPLFAREPSPEEQEHLDVALGSKSTFTMRRALVVRLSRQGLRAGEIAERLGCSAGTVRNGLRAFNERGAPEALEAKKSGPKTSERLFEEPEREQLLAIVRQSPRRFGRARSTWSLEALAEVVFEEGLTERQVSHETVRQALLALGHRWKRAKAWIRSDDPQYTLKKSNETA